MFKGPIDSAPRGRKKISVASARARKILPASRVRVLIVEDFPLIAYALRTLIGGQKDLETCGEAKDATEGLRMVNGLKPDVALVDITLSRGQGLELVRQIRKRSPNTRILVLCVHDDCLFADRALRAGAMGYINEQESVDDVLKAIREVHSGRIYLNPKMTQYFMRRTFGAGDDSPRAIESLSTREIAVFEMIGKGMTTREIAEKLHLSVKTVETYREKIKFKLKLKNGPSLIRHATQWLMESS